MSVKISDLLPEAKEVPVGRGKLSIQPLNLEVVTKLITEYKPIILELILSSKNGNPDYADILAKAPDLAAKVIALSANAEGQEDDIKKLPAASQIQLLITIWEVSVPDPKGLMSSLTAVFLDMKKELKVPPKVIRGKTLDKAQP